MTGRIHTQTRHDCACQLAGIEMSHFVRFERKDPTHFKNTTILSSFQYNKNVSDERERNLSRSTPQARFGHVTGRIHTQHASHGHIHDNRSQS